MCMIIKPGTKIKVAKNDIVCYKVFYKRWCFDYKRGRFKDKVISMFKNFEYMVGVKYELDGYIDPVYQEWMQALVINVALHSYSKLEKARHVEGRSGSRVVYECIIPQGSEYYHNRGTMEYASDAIIIVGPLTSD